MNATRQENLFPDPSAMRTSAVISDCGKYRYALLRVWNESLPVVVFGMLNPSTADHETNDPTIRRTIGFATAWGYGGVAVFNLGAYRTPYPWELLEATDPIGPFNDLHIKAIAKDRVVIAAWGASAERYMPGRVASVMEILKGERVLCLGLTKDGGPRHPLYVKSGVRTVPFVTAQGAPIGGAR